MPKKKATPRSDVEELTLQLARRLAAARGTGSQQGGPDEASLPEGERPTRTEAVDELMKRYSRSSPRRPRSSGEPPKE